MVSLGLGQGRVRRAPLGLSIERSLARALGVTEPPAYRPPMPEMSAPELAVYLRRIRLTHSVADLQALTREIERVFPTDEATPRLMAMIGLKAAQLTKSN